MTNRPLILAASLAFFSAGRGIAFGGSVIQYQGLLADAGGRQLSGNHLLAFTLWNAPVGGAEVWRESLYVETDKGIYRATLGRLNPIPSQALQGTYRIEVSPPPGTGWMVRSLGSSQEPAPTETEPVAASRSADAVMGDTTQAAVKGETRQAAVMGDSTKVVSPPRASAGEVERLQRDLETARQELERRKEAPAALPAVYQVLPGDTLRSVARKLYGNPERWADLYKANDDRVLRGGELTPGQRLIVPRDGSRPGDR